MDFQTLTTCLIAVTLLTITPGVDTLLVIRNSARGGWRDGIVSSFGICSGLFIHAAVSALGISIILLQTAWAFTLLKYAGAAYLIWLGLSSLRCGCKKDSTLFFNSTTKKQHFSCTRSLREGFLSNILNPKAVIFYMAFLPQFINPQHNTLYQSLFVALLHFSVAMVYGVVLATLTGRVSSFLAQPSYSRTFHWLTGGFLTFLGIRLLTEK